MAGTDVSQDRKIKAVGVLGTKRKSRLGIRIDMTPMVDIAFLLLIFFMVTTVFRRPLAMEVNMPEAEAKVEVPESNVMTIFVAPSDSLTYKIGKGDFAPLGWNDLLPTFKQSLEQNPDLIVLVKIHRDARYEDMVEMMDTMEDAGLERFSVVPMEERDTKILEGGP
jgi:biopolymer transport protein ExbD